MSMEARYCKSCKLAFIGKVCTGGHPNFKYSKAIPAGIEIPEGATVGEWPRPIHVDSPDCPHCAASAHLILPPSARHIDMISHSRGGAQNHVRSRPHANLQ